MHALADRLEFAPPPTPGMLRSMGLAVLAHAFLLAALTWGVQWKSESLTITAEAELWSSVPQQAAPKLIELPPEPSPVQVKAPTPPKAQPKLPDAQIALEREKLQQKKQQEMEKQRLELLKQKQQQLDNKRLQDKRDQDKKTAEDKKKSEQETKKLEAQRADNLKRMAGLAGATGESTSTGTALHSLGPSASYAGRIVDRIKSNTNFADSSAGKPTVLILVRAASGGTILSRKVVTSSGNKAWDEAVLRAIDKMDTLPRDIDGKIPEKVLSEGLELRVSL
jgi:colicin import membrane protein